MALSSDSDPENSPPREDDGEFSDLKMYQLQSRGNTEDAAVMDISEESPSKQASKGKSLKKSPKGKGQSPKKEKNKIDSKEKEGMNWGSGGNSNYQGLDWMVLLKCRYTSFCILIKE